MREKRRKQLKKTNKKNSLSHEIKHSSRFCLFVCSTVPLYNYTPPPKYHLKINNTNYFEPCFYALKKKRFKWFCKHYRDLFKLAVCLLTQKRKQCWMKKLVKSFVLFCLECYERAFKEGFSLSLFSFGKKFHVWRSLNKKKGGIDIFSILPKIQIILSSVWYFCWKLKEL